MPKLPKFIDPLDIEDYDADAIEEAEQKQLNEEDSKTIRNIQRENFKKSRDVEGDKNLAALVKLHNDGFYTTSPENIVGNRVKYLRELYGYTPTDLSRKIGINRTTLYHCENGDSPIKPKTVKKIIAGLDVDAYDFSYAPESYDEWIAYQENSLINVPKNIFEFRDYVLSAIYSQHFSYIQNGEPKRVPSKYILLLKNSLQSSFDILDLIAHDKEQK